MASFSSILAMFMIFMSYYSSLALASELNIKVSTISAAPAVLPGAPVYSPALSPDISPLFPSPGGEAVPPSESSVPTIPSSQSPPNPDVTVAPGPDSAFPPSGTLPESSTVSIAPSGPLNLVVLLGLLAACIMQLPGM
ncbi:classical arabinogalactan protein 26 [Quercus suber]|uniref:Classical arabinogalactan protein 26-like n=1 Tax=Quercus lobata TaxID=97700 RepID=A0A7N2N448_QUELO|nr:classical arabinogalactan protein 26-like [Quercus suber]XP_030947976.1 classical arabinogalactan protein 26-like [Quercus lobata]